MLIDPPIPPSSSQTTQENQSAAFQHSIDFLHEQNESLHITMEKLSQRLQEKQDALQAKLDAFENKISAQISALQNTVIQVVALIKQNSQPNPMAYSGQQQQTTTVCTTQMPNSPQQNSALFFSPLHINPKPSSMAVNNPDLQALYDCFINTLSPSPVPRRRAESMLAELSTSRPLYFLDVLCLVAEPNISEEIRQAAFVNLKNHLQSLWVSEYPPHIEKDEKDHIKAITVSFMLVASPRIQSLLSQVLVIIAKHEFPRLWPSLLPDLIECLQEDSQAGDYASVNGILRTANSIFKKFRHENKTNDLLHDLKYSLDNFAPPLLEIFMKTASLIESATNAGGGNAAALKPLFVSQRLCCRIFFSLNYQELPEFFHDHMDEWMTEQNKYLANSYPALESRAEGVALVDEVRAAVCENINLYLEKNEEKFQPYFDGFAKAVWNLLTTASQASSRDQLAVTAIKFLTTVSTGVYHSRLAADRVIPQIFHGIVIPNVRLRDEDVELFEMNYIEFIRRDMEGSDIDTRRRIACELLKGISTNYKQQVTDLVSEQIQNLLASFAINPAENWKDKDSAIYLVVSLATKRAGGTYVPTDLVDVQNFFETFIVPELQSQDVNGSPMLKAGALKFFTMFRNQLTKPMALQFFPDLIRFLCAESNVVHSYAASCIEKLLLVKDEGGQARYTSVDISSQLMNNLFEALKVPESEENQYVMKCIMRVLRVADICNEENQYFFTKVEQLTRILRKACENPRNPLFNHYVFECVAVLVKRACAKDAALIENFQIQLSSIIQKILVEDVQEFYPYVFQLKAQLVELSTPPIPRCYKEDLVAPKMWTKASNASALVLLLQAFLQKDELNREMLIKVLKISYDLVSDQRTDEQGFYVLNTIIKSLDFNVIAPHICQIWTAVFTVLGSRQTGKFIQCLLILMSLFLVKHDCTNLVNSVNGIQANLFVNGIQANSFLMILGQFWKPHLTNMPNLFLIILGQFWIPHLTNITGVIETKLTAVASTRLLCESQMLLDDTAVEQWGKLLNSIVTLLSRTEQERIEEDPEMPEFAENFVYSATFIRLHNAGKTEDDPLKDTRDAKELLVTSLSRLSALSPGRYPQIISQYVEPTNQAELLRLCNSYNCQII